MNNLSSNLFTQLEYRVSALYDFITIVSQRDDVQKEIEERFLLIAEEQPWTMNQKIQVMMLSDMLRWLTLSGHALGDDSVEELCALLLAAKLTDDTMHVRHDQLPQFYQHVAPAMRDLYDIPRKAYFASTLAEDRYLFEEFLGDMQPYMAQRFIGMLNGLVGDAEQRVGNSATTHFDDNHGVVVSGSGNTISVSMGKDGIEVKQAKQETQAAQGFDPRFLPYLQKARQKGWLDENFMPIEDKVSAPQLAYIAHTIAVEEKVDGNWSTHFDFWNIKNLRNYFYRGMNQKGMATFMTTVDDLFGTHQY